MVIVPFPILMICVSYFNVFGSRFFRSSAMMLSYPTTLLSLSNLISKDFFLCWWWGVWVYMGEYLGSSGQLSETTVFLVSLFYEVYPLILFANVL